MSKQSNKDKPDKKKDELAKVDPAEAKKRRTKAYEKEIARLQVETRASAGLGDSLWRAHCHHLRRPRCRGQGRPDQADHRNESSPRVFAWSSLSRPLRIGKRSRSICSATSRTCRPAGEVVIFDRSWYNRPRRRAGQWASARKSRRAASWRFVRIWRLLLIELRHHDPEILPDRLRGGAGAPLPAAGSTIRLRQWKLSPMDRGVVPALVGL